MKKLFISLFLVTFFILESSAQWKPAGDRIKTKWAEQINPSDVLPRSIQGPSWSVMTGKT